MTNTTATEDDTRTTLEKARANMRGRAEVEAAPCGIEAALSRHRPRR